MSIDILYLNIYIIIYNCDGCLQYTTSGVIRNLVGGEGLYVLEKSVSLIQKPTTSNKKCLQ